jgi:5-methylcytosine-specific restriction endonuclease McrA
MVVREYRQYTPEEKERLSRDACPHCGRERSHFSPGHEHTLCCQASCTLEYYFKGRSTIAAMRWLVRDEQGGKCAWCKREVREPGTIECVVNPHPYILDHIRPIAMGGDQWARDNLQVLCVRCNRVKTARDMGKIAHWKKYHCRGLAHREGNYRQAVFFKEDLS